jgi:hypothetical protein
VARGCFIIITQIAFGAGGEVKDLRAFRLSRSVERLRMSIAHDKKGI